MGDADPRPIAAAVLLNLVIVVAWAARSSNLLAGAGRPVPVLPLIPMTAFANTINNITPGSAGELVRLYLLRAQYGVDYTTGAAVVLIERVVAIVLLGASAASMWLTYALHLPAFIAVIAIIAVAIAPSLVYRAGIRPTAMIGWLPLGRLVGHARWATARSTLDRVDASVAALLVDPPRAIAFAGWTAAGVHLLHRPAPPRRVGSRPAARPRGGLGRARARHHRRRPLAAPVRARIG